MRILIAESAGYTPEALAIYRGLGEVILADADKEQLKGMLRNVDALVVRLRNTIDADMLRHANRLKVVVSPTTGLNHLDTELMHRLGIAILSLKGETEFLRSVTATAELTWCLLLNLLRPVCMAHRSVLCGQWNRDIFKGLELKGKTLGIVGYGRLGRMVAQYGQAFRMRVLGTDPYISDMGHGVEQLPLYELLRQSDVVSLHVPLNKETESFFNAECFTAMKHRSYFINTSRGELVDENSLVDSLTSGHLAGAGLDVLRGETSTDPEWLEQHPLLRYSRAHDNIIIVPHIGGATTDSMEATEIFMAKKLQNYMIQHTQKSPQ